ncbi:MAG: helix-turn-helix domain-containing protein [Candidatus Puniceispirillales bacterium]
MEKIRKIMKLNGMSQQKLAHILNVDRSRISRYLNGKDQVPRWHIKKLSELFDVPFDEISSDFEGVVLIEPAKLASCIDAAIIELSKRGITPTTDVLSIIATEIYNYDIESDSEAMKEIIKNIMSSS